MKALLSLRIVSMNLSDIVFCNGPMIARIRKTCGLTQEALAEAADLSVRVIRKAESGGEVRFSTLLEIATAMHRLGAIVQAGDLCTDPVEVVRTFVEAYRVHEHAMVSRIRHLLSEDLITFVAGDPAIIPFAGTFHGPDGLTEFLNRFFSQSSRRNRIPFRPKYYVNFDGSDVIAHGTDNCSFDGCTGGNPNWLSLKFDISGGIIVRFEYYFDTQSVRTDSGCVSLKTEIPQSPFHREY